ncbi:MAG TPA: xanthine dehydrogenase family protein subunit M, partial [Candidatus Dormibacteraeota bacterium]
MKPAPFKYVRPQTLDEAVALLAEHGDEAKILGGGQSLIPMMNMRLARPGVLVDITALSELDGISGQDGIVIGATTRQSAVKSAPRIVERLPLLVEALRWVAHPAIRNRGTFGGTVAHADPAAEVPAVIQALDGEVVARGPDGERTIRAEDFFLGMYATALNVDEVLKEVKLNEAELSRRWAFREVARRHGDFALAGVAATADVNESGRCRSARIVLFGVSDRPLRAYEAERRVENAELASEDVRRETAELAIDGLQPRSDVHG